MFRTTISFIIRCSWFTLFCSSVQTMKTCLTARSYGWNSTTEQKSASCWFVCIKPVMFCKDFGLGETSTNELRWILWNGNGMLLEGTEHVFLSFCTADQKYSGFTAPTTHSTVCRSKQVSVSNTFICNWRKERLGMLRGFQTFTLTVLLLP